MTLYLKDAAYLDAKTLGIRQTNIAVEKGPEGGLSFPETLPVGDKLKTGDRLIDCHGALVTHAFACGHHHIYSSLARGMPAPQKIPTNFVEVLEYIWWRLDKRLDREMIKASALAAALHMAKRGVTFCIDHHASPFAIEGCLTTIAEAFEKVGISHLLCYELSNRDGEGPADEGLAETDAYLASGHKGHVGLHASFTVDDNLLKRAVALAEKHDTGLHVHVAEDRADQDHCVATYGKRVVRRFADAGMLDRPHTILAHCIHLDEEERRLIRESGAWVVQNTESNLNNNVGLGDYRELGANVMFGTDGMHSDMLRSAKAAFLVGQGTEGLSFDETYRRFRNVHRLIAAMDAPGDGPNNLVIFDYDTPTDVTSENFLGHFVYGLDSTHIRHVIAQGRLIVEDRKVTTVDENEILAYAREQARRLWERLKAE